MRAKAERKVATAAAMPAAWPRRPAVQPDSGRRRRPSMPPIEGLHAALGRARGRLDGDPYANPIALLALDLEQRLGSGALDEHAAEALIQRLTREAFAERAAALRALSRRARPRAQSRHDPPAARRPGAAARTARRAVRDVRRRLERVYYGFVFTAHPTFGRTMELQTMLAARRVRARTADPERAARPWPGPSSVAHRPPARLDLAGGARAVAAGDPTRCAPSCARSTSIALRRRARALSGRMARAAAAAADPRDLGRLRHRRPRRHRLDGHLRQAADGAARPAAPLPLPRPGAAWRAPRGEPLAVPLLELLEARLALAIKSAEDDLVVLDDSGSAGFRVAQAAGADRARHGRPSRSSRLTHADQVLDLVERALAAVKDDRLAQELVHPARGAGGAGSGRRRDACADQRGPAAQRDPQDDRHGPRAGRPDAPPDLRQRRRHG